MEPVFEVPSSVARYEGKVRVPGWTLAYVLYTSRQSLKQASLAKPETLFPDDGYLKSDPIAVTAGFETVVASHGWLDNADSFMPLACQLVCQFPSMRVICLDLPGHGKSSHSASRAYSASDYLIPFVRFLHKLELHSFHFIGHSLSAGLLPFVLALLRPPLWNVRSVIGVEQFGTWRMNPAVRTFDNNEIINSLLKFDDGLDDESASSDTPKLYDSVDEIVKTRVHVTEKKYPGQQTIDARSARIILDRNVAAVNVIESGSRLKKTKYYLRSDPCLKQGSMNKLSTYVLTMDIRTLSMELLAKRLRCPVLVIVGDKGWPGVDIIAQQIAKKIKDGKVTRSDPFSVITLPGSHHIHIDNPTLCMERITPFYQSILVHSTIQDSTSSALVSKL